MSQLVKEVVATVIAVREAKQRIFIGGATFYSVNDIWLYIEISDDKLCDVCHANAHMEGGEYKGNRIRGFFPYHEILDINTIKVNQHPNCLLAGTLVTTDRGLIPIEQVHVDDLVLTHKGRYRRVIQLHRNKYDGLIFNIQDNWLTGNHPVLTSKGWIVASLLNEGDSTINIVSESIESPIICNQISHFSSVLPNFTWSIMPVSSIYFDSNFMEGNSEVNIVNINSKLWDNVNSSIFESIKKGLFKLAKSMFRLNSFSPIHKVLMRALHSSNFIMCKLDLIKSLLGTHLSPFQGFSFALSSSNYPRSFESTANNVSTNIEMFSNSVFAPPLDCVEFNDFSNWQTSNSERLLSQSQSPITHIDNMRYKGFVYNLSVAEDESYCIGHNNMAVHNCRCIMVRKHPILETHENITFW